MPDETTQQPQQQLTRVQDFPGGKANVREDGAIWLDYGQPGAYSGKSGEWVYNHNGKAIPAPAYVPQGEIPWEAIPQKERDAQMFTNEGALRALKTAQETYEKYKDSLFSPQTIQDYLTWNPNEFYQNILIRAKRGDQDALKQYKQLVNGEVRQWKSKGDIERANFQARQLDGLGNIGNDMIGPEGILPTAFAGAIKTAVMDPVYFAERWFDELRPKATGDKYGADAVKQMAYDIKKKQGTWGAAIEAQQRKLDTSDLYEGTGAKLLSQAPSQLLAMIPQIASGAAGGLGAAGLAGKIGVTGKAATLLAGLGSSFVEAVSEAGQAGNTALDKASQEGASDVERSSMAKRAFWGTLGANMALLTTTNNFGVMGSVGQNLWAQGEKEGAEAFSKIMARELMGKQEFKVALKQGAKMLGKEAGQSFLSEGLEEGLQGTIQRLFTDKKPITIGRIIDESVKSPEFWQDLVMGGGLGAVAGMAGTGLHTGEAIKRGVSVEATNESNMERLGEQLKSPEGRTQFASDIQEAAKGVQAAGGEVNQEGLKVAAQAVGQAQGEAMQPYMAKFEEFVTGNRPARVNGEHLDAAATQIKLDPKDATDAEALRFAKAQSGLSRSLGKGMSLGDIEAAITAVQSSPFKTPEIRSRAVEILQAAKDVAENTNRQKLWGEFVKTLPAEDQAKLRDIGAQEQAAPQAEAAPQAPVQEATVQEAPAPTFDREALTTAKAEIEDRVNAIKPSEIKMTPEMLVGRLAQSGVKAKLNNKTASTLIKTLVENHNDPVATAKEIAITAPHVLNELGHDGLVGAIVEAAAYRTALNEHAHGKEIAAIRREYDAKHGDGFFDAARSFDPNAVTEAVSEAVPEKQTVKTKGQTKPKPKANETKAEKKERKKIKVEPVAEPAATEGEAAEGQTPPPAKKKPAPKAKKKSEVAPKTDEEGVSLTKAGKKRGLMSPQRDLEHLQKTGEIQAEQPAAAEQKPAEAAPAKPAPSKGLVKADTKVPTPAQWNAKTKAKKSAAQIRVMHEAVEAKALAIQKAVQAEKEGKIVGELPSYGWSREDVRSVLKDVLPKGVSVTNDEIAALNKHLEDKGLIEKSTVKSGSAQRYRVVGTQTAAEIRAEMAGTLAEHGEGTKGKRLNYNTSTAGILQQLRPKPYMALLRHFTPNERSAIELLYGVGAGEGVGTSKAAVARLLAAVGFSGNRKSLSSLQNRVVNTMMNLFPATAPAAPHYVGEVKKFVDGLYDNNNRKFSVMETHINPGYMLGEEWAKQLAAIAMSPGWQDKRVSVPKWGKDGFEESKEVVVTRGFKNAFSEEVQSRIDALEATKAEEKDASKRGVIEEEITKWKIARRVMEVVASNASTFIPASELSWVKNVTDDPNFKLSQDEQFNTWIGAHAFTEGETAEALNGIKERNEKITQDAYDKIAELTGEDAAMIRENWSLQQLVDEFKQQAVNLTEEKNDGITPAEDVDDLISSYNEAVGVAQSAVERTKLPFDPGMTKPDKSGLMNVKMMVAPDGKLFGVPGANEDVATPYFSSEFNDQVQEMMALGKTMKGREAATLNRLIKVQEEQMAEHGAQADDAIIRNLYVAQMAFEARVAMNMGNEDVDYFENEAKGMSEDRAINMIAGIIQKRGNYSSAHAREMAMAWFAQTFERGGSDPLGWITNKLGSGKKGQAYVKSQKTKEEERTRRVTDNAIKLAKSMAGVAENEIPTGQKAKFADHAASVLAGVPFSLQEMKKGYGNDNGNDTGGGRFAAMWAVADTLADKYQIPPDLALTYSEFNSDLQAMRAVQEIYSALGMSPVKSVAKMGKQARLDLAVKVFEDAMERHASLRDDQGMEEIERRNHEHFGVTAEMLGEDGARESNKGKFMHVEDGKVVYKDSAPDAEGLAAVRDFKARELAQKIVSSNVSSDLLGWVTKGGSKALNAMAKSLGTSQKSLADLSALANEYKKMLNTVLKDVEPDAAYKMTMMKTKGDERAANAARLEARDRVRANENYLNELRDMFRNELAARAAAVINSEDKFDSESVRRAVSAMQEMASKEAQSKSKPGAAMAMGLAPLGMMLDPGSHDPMTILKGVGLMTAVVGLELGARYIGSKMGMQNPNLDSVARELFKRANGRLQTAATMVKNWFSEIGHKIGDSVARAFAKYASPELTNAKPTPPVTDVTKAAAAVRRAMRAGVVEATDFRKEAPQYGEKIVGEDGRSTGESIRTTRDRINYYQQNPGKFVLDYINDPRSMEGRFHSADLMLALMGEKLGTDYWSGVLSNPGLYDNAMKVVQRAFSDMHKIRVEQGNALNESGERVIHYSLLGPNAAGKTASARTLLKGNPSAFANEYVAAPMFQSQEWSRRGTVDTIAGTFDSWSPAEKAAFTRNIRDLYSGFSRNNISPNMMFVYNSDIEANIRGYVARSFAEGRAASPDMFATNLVREAVAASVLAQVAPATGVPFFTQDMWQERKGDSVWGAADAAKEIQDYFQAAGIAGLTPSAAIIKIADMVRKEVSRYEASHPDLNEYTKAVVLGDKNIMLRETRRVHAELKGSGPTGPKGTGTRSTQGPSAQQQGGEGSGGGAGVRGLGAPTSGLFESVGDLGVATQDISDSDIQFLEGGLGMSGALVKQAADKVQDFFTRVKGGPKLAGAQGLGVKYTGEDASIVKGKVGLGSNPIQRFLHNHLRQAAPTAMLAGGAAERVFRAVVTNQDMKAESYGKVEPILKAIQDRSKEADATPDTMSNLYNAVMLSSVKGDVLDPRMLAQMGLTKNDIEVYNKIHAYTQEVKAEKLAAIDEVEAKAMEDLSKEARLADSEKEFDEVQGRMEAIESDLNRVREVLNKSNFYLPLYRNQNGEYRLEVRDTKAKDDDAVLGVMLLTKEEAKSPEFVRQATSQIIDQYAQKLWAESDGSKPLESFRAEVQAKQDAGQYKPQPIEESIARDAEFRKHANAVRGVFDEEVLKTITNPLRSAGSEKHISKEAYTAIASALNYTQMAGPLASLKTQRQNVPGWSTDLPDVLRRYAWAEGNALAQARTVPEIKSALANLYDAATSRTSSIGKEVFDYMNDYVHGSLSSTAKGNKVSKLATSVLFYKTMGLKPITGVVNALTQGWMTSRPFADTVYRDSKDVDKVYTLAQRVGRAMVVNEMPGLGESLSQLDDKALRSVLDKYIDKDRFGFMFGDKADERLELVKDVVQNWVRSGLRETNTSDVSTFEGGSAAAVAKDTASRKAGQVGTYFMEKSEVMNRLRDVLWSSVMGASDNEGAGIMRMQDTIGGNKAMIEPFSVTEDKVRRSVEEEGYDLSAVEKEKLVRERTAREIGHWAESVNAINNFSNTTGYGSRMTWGQNANITRPLWILRGFGTNVMFHMGALHDIHQALDRGEGKKSSPLTVNKPYIRGVALAMILSGLFGMGDDLADVANLIANFFRKFALGKAANLDVRREAFDAVKDLGKYLEKNVTGKDSGKWGTIAEDVARGGIVRPFGADLGGMLNVSNAVDLSKGNSPVEKIARAVLGPWGSIIDAGGNLYTKPGPLEAAKALAPAGLVGPLDAAFDPTLSRTTPEAGEMTTTERIMRTMGINPTRRARAYEAGDVDAYIRATANEIQAQARYDFSKNGQLSEKTYKMLEDLREYETEKGRRITRTPSYGSYMRSQRKRTTSILENVE